MRRPPLLCRQNDFFGNDLSGSGETENESKKGKRRRKAEREKEAQGTPFSKAQKCSLFADIAVGAVDDVVTGVAVPSRSFADRVPLRFRTAESDADKRGAIRERITSNSRHARRNNNAGDRTALIKSGICTVDVSFSDRGHGITRGGL